MDEEKHQKLKDYAFRFLSFRPRSLKEVKGRLMQFSIKRGIPPQIGDQVINELTSQGLIDDTEFAKWWIEQRHTFRPKGTRVIRMELLQKGVSREIVEQVLTLTVESKNKELELAFSAASKKLSLWHRLPKDEIKIKVGNFLARRGFDWEIIYKVIDSLVKKS